MKLPDFSKYVPLNQLRQQMGAELVSWNSGEDWQPTDLDKILVKTGIEIPLIEIEIDFDGTHKYKGRKVAVYIRDQYGSSDSKPDQLNKLHIADCSTLQAMRRQGRYERYVVTTRTDGLFIVNFLGSFSSGLQEEGVECRLFVCINCLKRLSYKNYNRSRRSEQIEIKESFNLEEFFERYGNQITSPPTQTDITAQVNIYPPDLVRISRRYKEQIGWHCEQCQVYFGDEDMQKFLHLHHVDGLKHNNRNENLRALCIGCHAEQPQHQHLKNTADYREYLRISQN